MKENNNFRTYLVYTIKGFIMGASDIVPGVSGGTMALILGIYEKLVLSIRSLFNKNNLLLLLKFKLKAFFGNTPWKFLFALGFGILLAIFTLSHPLEWLLENNPTLIWAFFFGLVAASIFFVRKRIKKWDLKIWLIFILGAIFAYVVAGLIPSQTPATPLFFFLSGAIAISAMILPGISGSFLLVILGKYEQILHAVNARDFYTLGIFVAGVVVGVAIFVQILSWLLKNHHDITFAFLVGLMVGSLRKVWPWKAGDINVWPNYTSLENLVIFGLMIAGFLVVLALLRLNHRDKY